MGKSIQIRDVPDDIHRELKRRAAAAGVSLSDYLLGEVARVAERPAVSDVLRMAGTRQGGTRPGAVVAAIRAARDQT